MKKQAIKIRGMHCRSCEILLEDCLCEVPNVRSAVVNHRSGTAVLQYKGSLDLASVDSAVRSVGYELGEAPQLPLVSTDREVWRQLSVAAMVVMSIYFIASVFGIGDIGAGVSNNYSSLPVVFLVGLTAGVSTCMALVGGLVLGVSAKFAKTQPMASAQEKFTPHLLFNIGRIVTFFVLGGLIGWLGSVLQISMSVVGFLTILVGLSMFFLGLQLTEAFPHLSGLSLTLPKGLSRMFGLDEAKQASYSHKNALALGGLTFFLPCGFTQAMQLYAMSTGNPLAGALTMGVFALGTAPGLLGIGGLTSVIKGEAARYFFKFAGLVVILLALFNLNNGLNLTGWNSLLGAPAIAQESNGASQAKTAPSGEVQVLKGTYSPEDGVQPAAFTVTAGRPARIEILAKDDGYGCMGSFALPGLSKKVAGFKKGQTVVMDFTPTKPGTYKMTCAMGIPHGTITVKS